MRYQYLLFDADGTLFDFEKTEQQAFMDTMEQYHIPFSAEQFEMYRDINISYWKKLEQGLITKDALLPKRYQDFLERIEREDLDPRDLNRTYLSRLGEYSFLFPQSLPLCRKLSEKYRLLLVTNGVYTTQIKRFDRSSIKPYFQEMIVSEKIGFTKPDSRYFDYVFRKYSIQDKGQTLIIGDSLSADIKGGRDYGMDTCYYNPSKTAVAPGTCTYEISQLEDLLGILDEPEIN